MIFVDQSELTRMGSMAANPSTGLSEIILHPSIFVALRMNESTIINYLCMNIENLLKLAFGDISTPESTTCFEILLLMIPDITNGMINGVFYNFASKLLSFPLQDSIVGRLGNLTFKLLESGITGSLDSCGFLFKLLKYAGNSSVSDMFVGLLDNRPELEVVQHWLANKNFEAAVMKHFREIETNKITRDDFMAEDTEKLCAFYEIMESGIQNTILSYSFICNEVIECLSYKKEFICYVEDQRWNAIITLALSKPKSELLKPLIQLAKKFIYQEFDHSHQFHGLIIDLLRFTLPQSMDDEVITKVVGLIHKFPECSLLHCSITSFLTKALNMKLVDEIDLQVVANQVYKLAQSSCPGTVVHATTMDLLIILTKYGKKHKKARKMFEKIDGFSAYSKCQLKSYRKSLDTDYGKNPGKKFSFGLGSKK